MQYLLETAGKRWWVEADNLGDAIRQLDGFEKSSRFETQGSFTIACYARIGHAYNNIGTVYNLTHLYTPRVTNA